jgi:hypothetical protein
VKPFSDEWYEYWKEEAPRILVIAAGLFIVFVVFVFYFQVLPNHQGGGGDPAGRLRSR